jgi:hypothetical protein
MTPETDPTKRPEKNQMTHPEYPVVERRALAAPRKHFLRGQWRDPSDLPVTDGHHRLVYRVNGRYELDNAALKSRDEKILAADHVSVVDVSKHVEVRVQLKIRSADDSEMTVEVAFTCSVTDPVMVVESGLNAQRLLTSYLEGHHRFYELAIEFPDSEINEIRRHVNAQVTAFTTVEPPRFAGLDVAMASVQVHTPEEWAEYAKRRREETYDHTLQTEHDRREFELESERTHREQLLEAQRKKHQHTIEYSDHQQEQLIETDRQRLARMRHDEEQELIRRQVRLDAEAFGDDPILALARALQAGKIDEREFADLLREQRAKTDDRAYADRRDQIEWERRQIELNRAEYQENVAWEREKYRIEIEDQREGTRREHEQRVKEIEAEHQAGLIELEQKREQALRAIEWERTQAQQEFTASREDTSRQHEIEMAKLQNEEERNARASQEAREERIRRLQWEREDHLRKADLNEQLIKGLLNRGHFDTQPVSIDIQQVIDPQGSQRTKPENPELESEPEARQIPAAEPREDD